MTAIVREYYFKKDELKKMGYEIKNKTDITKEMQEKFLSTNNKR